MAWRLEKLRRPGDNLHRVKNAVRIAVIDPAAFLPHFPCVGAAKEAVYRCYASQRSMVFAPSR